MLRWISLAQLCVCAYSSSYYHLLQLEPQSATPADARRQFRKLSVRLHPDKNPAADTPAGREAFAELRVAAEWLGDDDKKQLYDLYGVWDQTDDHSRGHQYASQHSTIEFFRDDTSIVNVRTEAQAQRIFGLQAKHTHIMMLYSPWLTASIEATVVYRRVARRIFEQTGETTAVQLAAVNCESNLQQFCLRYGRLSSQFDLPVLLLIDPTDGLIDRYRGRVLDDELTEYVMASNHGMNHVHNLDSHNFVANVGTPDEASNSLWLILFCSDSERMCKELKPVMKRLAFSARATAKVGFVDCKMIYSADGYSQFDDFCRQHGVADVPSLVAHRRGIRDVHQGEIVPLFVEEGEQDVHLAMPLIALRAMEVVLRLSAPIERAVADNEFEDPYEYE